MRNKYYLTFLVLFMWAGSVFCQTKFSVVFEKSSLSIQSLPGEDGTIYNVIRLADMQNSGEPGVPDLPAKYVSLSVPSDAETFDVVVENIQTESILLERKIFPTQYPVPTLVGFTDKKFTKPNEGIYSSVAPFPRNRVSIVHDGFLDGDKRILTLVIYPAVYFPGLQKIEFAKQISLKVMANRTNIRSAVPMGLSPKNELAEDILQYLKSQVVNPEDIEKNISYNFSKVKSQNFITHISIPYFEYCVITSRKLSRSFERLVAWKREKGLNAGIICVEDILADNAIVGDLVSNLYDDAAKIRGYLQLAYQYGGTKYVLFGGNDKVLPIRYGSGNPNTWSYSGDSIAGKIPTDLYFSDLDGNWNKDGDKYLGEFSNDSVDYLPELYVGRILCSTPEEVDLYTTKLLKYEQNPGNGDFSYLKKAFYCQSDQMQAGKQANIIAKDMQGIFPQYTIVEEFPSYNAPNPIYPTGKAVIDSMNQPRRAFLGWFGHGNPGGISVRVNGNAHRCYLGILALEGNNAGHEPEEGNGLDNLTNLNYPAIAYSIACTVTPYDNEKNNYSAKYNVGESFTVGGLYGGPAFIGNTRYGWVSFSYLQQQEFNKQIKNGIYKIGVAEALSKNYYGGQYKHWIALANNLIGCPEFEIWTDIPLYFNDVMANHSSSSVNVSVPVVDSVIVSVRGLFNSDYVARQTLYSSSPSVNFTGLPQNIVITVDKHNYLPHILPLFAQNEDVSDFNYIHVSDARLGRNVTDTKPQGDLVIKLGAEVILEKSGIVSLEAGFNVEKGGVFEIK